MIAIIDSGVSNLFSLTCSLRYIGADYVVTSDPGILEEADRLILPGVGAFGDAAGKISGNGLDRAVVRLAGQGKPLLGICLGMQLLYERSFEYGEHLGLGLLRGSVRQMTPELLGGPLGVPHMGWNSLHFQKECPLLRYINEGDCVYFVHSYFAAVSEDTAAAARYGDLSFSAVVQQGNVYGTQFHPEKSGDVGLSILRAFAEMEVD